MKSIILALACAVSAAAAGAAPTLESASAAAEGAFQCLPTAQFSFKTAAKAAGRAKAASLVRVSGDINLSGSGTAPRVPGFVSVTFNNLANICDSAGQICSGYRMITTYANLFVTSSFVSDWVRPEAYVAFYKDGRYVGSTWVRGDIHVTGWVNGNWVTVSGWGPLTGELTLAQ